MNDEPPLPCECPAAGWCARHRRPKIHQQWLNCRTSDRYRRYWDEQAPFLQMQEIPEAAVQPTKYVRVALGNIAARMLKKLGISPCGGCLGRQAALNRVTFSLPAAWAKSIEAVRHPVALPAGFGRRDDQWATAITTAPRATVSVLKSLQSLAAAGWTDVRIFAEPGSIVPDVDGVTIHEQPRGVFQNWRFALETIRNEKPDAEFYMVCQDDVVYSRNLKAFLEADLWFAGDVGFVSPYRSSGKQVDGRWNDSEIYIDHSERGRDRCKPRNGLWGALTYIFPRGSVDVLLTDPALRQRERMIDLAIHPSLAKYGRRAWYYNPSLAEHLEGPSSLGHGQGQGMNSGGSFRGEEFDCLTLLKGAAA